MDLSDAPGRSLRKLREDGVAEVLQKGTEVLVDDVIIYQGIYKNLLRDHIDFIQREELRNWKKSYVFDEYSKPLRFKGPTGFRDLDTPDRYTPGQRFVSEISDATLLGPVGPGRTNRGRVIADTVGTPPLTSRRVGVSLAQSMTTNGLRRTLSALSGNMVPDKQFETATLAATPWDNYYHWTVECLVRVRLLERYGAETGVYPTLLVPSNCASWMTESLDIIDYNGKIACFGEGIATVDTLVIPTFPDPIPAECFWLHDRMRENGLGDYERGDRIYVSRSDATVRRVSNQDDIKRTLDTYGIDTYVLGDFTVREQIDLFSSAEFVIAPHGAGLTNILYGDELTVVELFGDKIMASFDRLAENMGHEYHYLQCEQDGLDIHVDKNKLAILLEQLLSE